MEKSKSYQSSANYEQRNKTVVKSASTNQYGGSTKDYNYLSNNNNNEVNYKSNKFQVDNRKNEIVPINKDEEWTKSKKIVNHKTRQIETRIQRQIVMEDGKVIADSGPQVTQRTKEDIKTEELEGSSGKGGREGDLSRSLEDYKGLPGEAVVSEKVETRNTTREARQEQLQYHDESIKELTGYDIHRKALTSPNELIQLDESEIDSSRPRGKLVHYAAKSKKFADREEMKEVSKRQRDGTITTEKVITQHHEEVDDDELPEDKVDSNALPEASKESTKEIQYHRDWNDSLRSTSRSKSAVEENEKSEKRYSSMDRSSENYEKNRSTSVDRRSTTSSHNNKEKSVPIETEYSPRVLSPDHSRQSPNRSRFDRYDADYSVDDKYQQSSSMSRRDESRYSNRSVSSSIKEKPFKEDASVQASFSEDSSDDEAYGRTSRDKKSAKKSESHAHRIEVESNDYSRSRLNETPKPTGSYYYFGQEAKEPVHRRELSSDRYSTSGRLHQTSERQERCRTSEERQQIKSSMSQSSSSMDYKKTKGSESVDWFNTLDARTLMDELERECQAELSIKDPTPESSPTPDGSRSRSRGADETIAGQSRYSTSGEIKGNVKHEFKSTSNGQVINDTSRNEAFHRSFNSPEEREDATRSFNKLMDTTFGKSSRESMSPLMYDGSIRHIPIERQDSSQSRREHHSRSSSTTRDNDYNSMNRRSYNSSRTNSPSRLSDRFRYSDGRSPSRSPERRGTFTKSRASPTINSDYPPYKSDLMRKSPYFSRENKNY